MERNKVRSELISNRAESIRVMHSLFQARQGGSIPTSALSLWFDEATLTLAKKLNRLWHSRFPEFGGGNARVSFIASCGQIIYAVAIWTNPSSPKLPQLSWMMLKRFAIAPDRPKNTASRMMGWMIRKITAKFPAVVMLVSYSDPDSHEGIIYRSTGWQDGGITTRGKSTWKNRERRRAGNKECRRVQRWLYPIRRVTPESP